MIKLNDTLDITADVERVASDSAAWSDIFGMIAKKRDYVVNDPTGRYNPFAPRGYLNRNPWRAMSIRETDEYGATIFDGQIYDVQPRDDGKKRTLILSCRDPLGVKLDWPVNMCDLTTFAGWEVAAYEAVGQTQIALSVISGSPLDVPVNSIVSFDDDYSPSYLVTAVDTGTDTITLDRATTEEITGGTVVNVAVPTRETPARAIERAFESAGIDHLIDSSFSIIDLADQAAGYYLWFFITPQNKIKLRDFISQVMELGDIYLSVSSNGRISSRRGLRHDGVTTLDTITASELIAPLSGPYYDTTRLIYAYDVLYTSAATSVVSENGSTAITGDAKIISNQVSGDTIDEYAATDVWRPVNPSSSDLREYTILYASETSARYFGERRLSYFGVARPRIKAGLKQAISGRPDKKYSISLFDDFSVSFPVAQGIDSADLNGVVVAYSFDFQNRRYSEIEIELTGGAEPQTATSVNQAAILTESGESLTTESGEGLILEG